MTKFWITTFALLVTVSVSGQQFSVGVGVFTGITSSFPIDKGINQDPRYSPNYAVKFAPIGVTVEADYEGFGVFASPGIVNLGQDFYVVNTLGGQDGRRTMDLQYLTVPIGFKVHIISLSFFKVSGVVSVGPGFLLSGTEMVTHTDSKCVFLPVCTRYYRPTTLFNTMVLPCPSLRNLL